MYSVGQTAVASTPPAIQPVNMANRLPLFPIMLLMNMVPGNLLTMRQGCIFCEALEVQIGERQGTHKIEST
jgi:hypothetical protein